MASALGASIARIDPRSGAVSQTVSIRSARAAALTFGGGALRVADAAGDSLVAIDPVAGKVVRTLPLSVHPNSLAFADGMMWIADYGGASVAEVDLRTGQTVADIHTGGGPSALAVGLGGVWVANSLDSTVSRINPLDGSVVATIPVGSGPSALLLNDELVRVANEYAATVSRIDPARNAVVGTSSVGGSPAALVADASDPWVAARALVQHRGGALTLAHTRVLDIDPAVNVDVLPLQSDGLARDGLVTYNHVPGPDGTQLIPDLAMNLPAPTDGGTSYTFRLRAGVRYPTAGWCARRISGSRSSVCSAFDRRKARRSTTYGERTLAGRRVQPPRRCGPGRPCPHGHLPSPQSGSRVSQQPGVTASHRRTSGDAVPRRRLSADSGHQAVRDRGGRPREPGGSKPLLP